jgi:3',5'-cyclic AMP phosphodiesterase CpdA
VSAAALGAASVFVAAFGSYRAFAAPQAQAAIQAPAASAPAIPRVYANITATPQGTLVFQPEGRPPLREAVRPPVWTLAQVRGTPSGTANGIALDFGRPDFSGTLIFGLIPYQDTRYPQPVYRTSVPITGGKAEINIKTSITARYDLIGWAKAGTGVLGYRVISQSGGMIHDGRVRFKGAGPFDIDVTMIEGPFVANVTPHQAVIWFQLDRPAPCSLVVGTRTVPCREGEARQELTIDRLQPGTNYAYRVQYAGHEEAYGFHTAPAPGSRKPFVFAYASDSRGGQGGGERAFSGPNAYIIRRLMAVATSRKAAFMQFTGDLVGGYSNSPDALTFELANWKRAIEPQAHWIPVYTTMGNHDSVQREFSGEGAPTIRIDRFPFETESAEAIFAREMVNPENGPASEDGSAPDPDPKAIDFPSYRRNVYWYQHDNMAMVVLNSDYWFAPSVAHTPQSGGNLHGYLMDRQMAWLERTLTALERNTSVDHVFITVHTPVFPNGGHVGDAMWYSGNNVPRPTVAGTPVAKGIIERRDELLTLIQGHPKVLAVLTGDEHNYNRMRLNATVPIYPKGWDKPRVTLKRPFFQINNGAAGAPYYAQEVTPWSASVRGFSSQHAICLFYVEGLRVRLQTVNPETLEVLDRVVLR